MVKRQANGKAKRKNEVLIQAWFNPKDSEENRILDTITWVQNKYNLSRKEAIIWLTMYFLDSEKEPERTLADEISDRVEIMLYQMSDRLVQSITEISNLVSSGALVATNEQAQNTLNQFQQEFDEIGLSVAKRYRAVSFEDDEE